LKVKPVAAGDLTLKSDREVEIAPEALNSIGDEIIRQFHTLVRVRIVDVHMDNVIGSTLVRPSERMRNAAGRLHREPRAVHASDLADE
jgi:hypothetical protein